MWKLCLAILLLGCASAQRGNWDYWSGDNDWGWDGPSNDWGWGNGGSSWGMGSSGSGSGGGMGSWGSGTGSGSGSRPPPGGAVITETRSFDEMYKAALAEGGKVVVYAGADTVDFHDGRKAQFEAKYPGIKVEIIADLSDAQSARIDNQLATKTIVADVIHSQNVQDFVRWRDEGALLNYKPLNWVRIYPKCKDTNGAFIGLYFITHGIVINPNAWTNVNDRPKLVTRLLKPDMKNKLTSTYPNDDDAVLFWYKLMIDKYGWNFMQQLASQNVTYIRGTLIASRGVGSGKFMASLGTIGPTVPVPGTNIQLLLESEPFVSWQMTSAILKNAPHPAGAKLYQSYIIDPSSQNGRFSCRDDIPSPTNKTIWQYPNTNPDEYSRFVVDRVGVEKLRNQIKLYVGDVQGPSPTGNPGTHPVQALPQ